MYDFAKMGTRVLRLNTPLIFGIPGNGHRMVCHNAGLLLEMYVYWLSRDVEISVQSIRNLASGIVVPRYWPAAGRKVWANAAQF